MRCVESRAAVAELHGNGRRRRGAGHRGRGDDADGAALEHDVARRVQVAQIERERLAFGRCIGRQLDVEVDRDLAAVGRERDDRVECDRPPGAMEDDVHAGEGNEVLGAAREGHAREHRGQAQSAGVTRGVLGGSCGQTVAAGYDQGSNAKKRQPTCEISRRNWSCGRLAASMVVHSDCTVETPVIRLASPGTELGAFKVVLRSRDGKVAGVKLSVILVTVCKRKRPPARSRRPAKHPVFKEHFFKSHRSGLNRRPLDYESSALPLSYCGD